MRVLIPGLDDPLEEETATHSRVLAWTIPWTEEPGGIKSIVAELDLSEVTAYSVYKKKQKLCPS